MRVQKQAIVIVDVASNGQYLAPAFIGRGYQCIHIETHPIQLEPYEHSFFTKIFNLETDGFDRVIEELHQYSIRAVICGTERSVSITDQIAAHFDVLRNCAHSSSLRRHKFFMIDALKKAGIAGPEQFYSDNLEEILTWYEQCGFKKVVLKPTESAMSDGLGICHNTHEISTVFKKNINKINYVGNLNTEYVIQECLTGKHYLVNTVSIQGKHFVSDIWLDVNHHEEGYLVDEYAMSIARNASEFGTLTDYIYQVLDALKIENGPAHAEVMLTTEGPKLIEIGARLPGFFDFSVIEECHGYSQLSLTVDSLLEPHLFEKRIHLYQEIPSKTMRLIYMYSEVEGSINEEVDLNEFLQIPSVFTIKSDLTKGMILKKTKLVTGHPGYAMLLSNNQQDMERDYERFRTLEKAFYQNLLSISD